MSTPTARPANRATSFGMQQEKTWQAITIFPQTGTNEPLQPGFVRVGPATLDSVMKHYNVDPDRVYLAGYSNGGFMSYRMACEHADQIAAIVSLGGATFLDAAECTPSEPVSILEIHGTKDETIEYEGGSTIFGSYPSVPTTIATWAAYNGCPQRMHGLDEIDIESELVGKETSQVEFLGCPVDGAVELWFISGGSHSPSLAPEFAADIIDWLYAHPNA